MASGRHLVGFRAYYSDNEGPPPAKRAPSVYNFLYLTLGLAGFLMVMIIVEQKVAFTQSKYGGSATVMLFLLVLPLGVAIMEEHKIWKSKKSAQNEAFQMKTTKETTPPSLLEASPAPTNSFLDPSTEKAAQVSSC